MVYRHLKISKGLLIACIMRTGGILDAKLPGRIESRAPCFSP